MFGFAKKLIVTLVCPQDGQVLRLDKETQADAEKVFSGQLSCPRCQKIYQIKEGILYFLPAQEQLADLKELEMNVRDQQTKQYDQRLSTRHHKEIPSTLKLLDLVDKQSIIEYGCGTGRLTEIIAKTAGSVLAVDFSLASLRLLGKKLADCQNVGLVWADAVQFKTAPKVFSRALAAQVYEHIPTLLERQTFLQNIKDSLQNTGQLVMTVYHYDRYHKSQPQQGQHPSGIFYHYFLKKELAIELEEFFNIKTLRAIDITIPGERFLHLSPRSAGFLSRLLENLLVFEALGHLLAVKVSKK